MLIQQYNFRSTLILQKNNIRCFDSPGQLRRRVARIFFGEEEQIDPTIIHQKLKNGNPGKWHDALDFHQKVTIFELILISYINEKLEKIFENILSDTFFT